jgi:hypothetical protein
MSEQSRRLKLTSPKQVEGSQRLLPHQVSKQIDG